MNSAARPRNDTTKLNALATGLRLITTAAPKITVSSAKIQNRNGDISGGVEGWWSSGEIDFCPRPVPLHENTSLLQFCSFLLVPFQYDTVNDATHLEEFFLVMHHLCARVTSNGIILTEENRLLGANLFAHSAVDAANHVDIECFWVFLDFGEAISRRDLAGYDFDRARRTDEFAKLACDAAYAPALIADERRRAAIIVREVAVPFLLRVLHRNFGSAQQQVFEMLKRDGQAGDDRRQVRSFAPVQFWSWNSNS